MKNRQVVLVALATGIIGALVGVLVTRATSDASKPGPTSNKRADPRLVSNDRKVVDIHPEDPALGPASAKVTLVEFSDFQ